MHTTFEYILLLAYCIPALILMLFGLNLYFTLFLSTIRRRSAARELNCIMNEFQATAADRKLPRVVTQIPVYNEFNVIERVVRAAAAMDYPAGRHTVQILDDSNDRTRERIDRVAAELRAQGRDVQVLRRGERVGYKAGALAHGMRQTDADFFAIFDADFVPPADFLMRTIPVLLARPKVGVVQARWGHLNEKASLLTIAQGIGIDAHFAVEQPARAWNNLFMNFNGTAGVWRRQAIEAAGGWQHDTLTEDMDLSYRAQLAGWKPFYIPDLVVEGEIPENINAYKTQQFRWAKGSIQTAIKLLPRIFRSDRSWVAKLEAVFHMTYYGVYPLMVTVILLALPVYRMVDIPITSITFALLSALLVVTTLAPPLICAISQTILHRQGIRKLRYFPVLLTLGIGLAICNSRAVLEALMGIKSGFIRTPKKGDLLARVYRARLSWDTLLELALAGYCLFMLVVFLAAHKYLAIPWVLVNAAGFMMVAMLSIWHFVIERRWAAQGIGRPPAS